MKIICVEKLLFLLTLGLFAVVVSFSQTVHSPVKTGSVQLSAYGKQLTDPFAASSNVAALASHKAFAAGLFSEQRFLLKELNLSALAVAVPVKSGGIGLQLAYFGSGGYNESQLGIAYAKKLGAVVDLGLQFSYYRVSSAGYQGAGTFNFAIAMMLHPSEKIQLGFQAYNPVGGKLGKNGKEKLASVYNFGMGYEASDQVLLVAEMVKEEDKPVNVYAALHYAFAKQFFARLGIASASASPFAGAGLRKNKFRLDITVSYHPQLGFTPGLLLLCYLKKSETS